MKKLCVSLFVVLFLCFLFFPIIAFAQNQPQITRITIISPNTHISSYNQISIEGIGISFTGAGEGFVPNVFEQCGLEGCYPMKQIDLGLDSSRTYMNYIGKGNLNETSFLYFTNYIIPTGSVIRITSPTIVLLRTPYRQRDSFTITQPANLKARLFGYVANPDTNLDPPLFDTTLDMNGTVTAEFYLSRPDQFAFFPKYELRKVTYTFSSE